MNRIVYLSYGKDEFKCECVVSILSLLKVYKSKSLPFQIEIFTDEEDFFKKHLGSLPIRFSKLDHERIEFYKGDIHFNHRVKLNVLKDSLKTSGSVLMVDTDSIFTKEIHGFFDQIQNGQVFMHQLEGPIYQSNNPLFEQIFNSLIQNQDISNDFGINSAEFQMWNSGILGVHSSQINLVEQALKFTDQFYPKCSNHLIEQFALSVFLGKYSKIKPTYKWVIHYWNYKPFSLRVSQLFEKSDFVINFKEIESSEEFKKLKEIYRPSIFKKIRYLLFKN